MSLELLVTPGEDAIDLGRGASATGDNAIAIGAAAGTVDDTTTDGAFATALKAIAVGNGAKATAVGAMAVGSSAEASAVGANAVGRLTEASAVGAIAVGDAAIADAIDAVALGDAAEATAVRAIQIGTGTNAVADTWNIAGVQKPNSLVFVTAADNLAIPVTYEVVQLTAYATGVAATLADGLFIGQNLTLAYAAEASAGDTIVITPAHLVGNVTITLGDLGDGCLLNWAVGGWVLIATNGGALG